jgi:hypothetical protein
LRLFSFRLSFYHPSCFFLFIYFCNSFLSSCCPFIHSSFNIYLLIIFCVSSPFPFLSSFMFFLIYLFIYFCHSFLSSCYPFIHSSFNIYLLIIFCFSSPFPFLSSFMFFLIYLLIYFCHSFLSSCYPFIHSSFYIYLLIIFCFSSPFPFLSSFLFFLIYLFIYFCHSLFSSCYKFIHSFVFLHIFTYHLLLLLSLFIIFHIFSYLFIYLFLPFITSFLLSIHSFIPLSAYIYSSSSRLSPHASSATQRMLALPTSCSQPLPDAVAILLQVTAQVLRCVSVMGLRKSQVAGPMGSPPDTS